MSLTRIAVINITGYIGAEVARLLCRHPKVEIVSVTGRTEAGKRLGSVMPHLSQLDLMIDPAPGEADLVFSALPHNASAEAIVPLVAKGVRVIDLSADFRLKRAEQYQQWYDHTHPAPELLQKAIYGIPELHRSEVAKAQLVANPGCYPTGAILALAPAVKAGIIKADIIVDSKSGVSGAGRALTLATHYAEANENASAYSMAGHRHLPEIVQELQALQPGETLAVTFQPHLIPMTRGILSTCYAPLAEGKVAVSQRGAAEVQQLYRDFYKGETFVKVVDTPPQTKQAWGSNLCLIHPTIDLRTGRLIVVSCIDNLVKGGAGQAIQNMNLMLGFPEAMGLEGLPVYP
ncbi:MAG: N-acetyl-gamma-glutamyl-phosphate reductase [Dehalococcoidia bacterium]|nr:N-acetyl-gamma-glutamyl-phosphate reductase [Dehalococcoidia bacterium]